MRVPVWVAELARGFWADVGESEPFPRDLRRPLARALPLSLILLPQLRIDSLRTWLCENGVVCRCPEADRPLRACLAAHSGHGLIFLDGADPADEQRFSLAHELAHFLRHYWQPRRHASRRLGEQVVEVLDGWRAANPEERLQAALKDVSLGLHLHLLQRGPRRQAASADIARAEEEADRLAFELLAPAEEIFARAGAVDGDAGRSWVAETLRTAFGLPGDQAEDYSRLLLPPVWRDPVLKRLHS